MGAALSIYSSRTTIILYNPHTKSVEELTLTKKGKQPPKWVVTIPKLEMEPKSKNFSPEGVKSCAES